MQERELGVRRRKKSRICEMIRKSKNKVIGQGSRKLADIIYGRGCYILNGKTVSDWEGEFTYIEARDSTIIDYIIVNKYVQEKVLEFRIGDRVDSDHMPLTMKLEEVRYEGQRERRKERGGRGANENEKINMMGGGV